MLELSQKPLHNWGSAASVTLASAMEVPTTALTAALLAIDRGLKSTAASCLLESAVIVRLMGGITYDWGAP